jgi:hypothetical protein
MPISPLPPCYSIEKQNGDLRISIPSTKKVSFFIAAVFSLFFFTCLTNYLYMGWVATNNSIKALSRIPENEPNYVTLFMFAVFLIGFILVIALPVGLIIYRVLWVTTGREIINVNSKTTMISYQMFLRNKSKEYWSDKIIDLRVNETALFWKSGDMIKFDYGSKTFTFGKEITEAEARQLIFIMKRYLEQKTG